MKDYWADDQAEKKRVKEGGQRLKRLREDLHLNQRDVAEKTGNEIVYQQVGKLERGETKNPSMHDLVLLGKIYNQTPDQVAEMYGYWERSREQTDPILRHIERITRRLTPEQRQFILSDLLSTAVALIAEHHWDDGLDAI